MSLTYRWFENLTAVVGEIAPDSITSRTIFQDEALKVIVFGFAAGQCLSEHTASMPAAIQILSGEGTVSMGGQEHPVKAGAWFHMDAQLPHSVNAATPLTMLLIMVKAQRQAST